MLGQHAQVVGRTRLQSTHFRDSANRILDLIVALGGLIVLAPLMLFLAFAVWAESGRPIFFFQVRLGKSGRKFRIIKFRKFHHDSELGGPAVTIQNDGRMTRVGTLLARTKCDELPQLWNIVKGEMSIVGPRPETLEFSDCYDGSFCRVLQYKPGIFGPSQVIFRYESLLYPESCDPHYFYRVILFPMKARIDLAYFPNRSLFLDLVWIVRGVWAVLGFSSLPSKNLKQLEHIEDWIRCACGGKHVNQP
jgi:lipopolysaccharide/colanic/teichoic acid biosynthesis glycosyltransferase